MVASPDTTVLTSPENLPVILGNVLITPTGASQTTLAASLGSGSAILSASNVWTGGNTFTATQTFNGGIGGYGQVKFNYAQSGGTINSNTVGINNGPAVANGQFYSYQSYADAAAFDVATEIVHNVTTYQPLNNPANYLNFSWIFTPSDSSHSWGAGVAEWNISNRVLNSPGWHRDRTTGPQNTGGLLTLGIATTNAPKTLTNPFATTNGSGTVTVTMADHMMVTGQSITFSGASPVAGLTISGSYSVTAINSSTFTINAGSNANATVAAGGGTVSTQQYNGQDILYAYSNSQSADFNTQTGRAVKTYVSYMTEPNANVGVGRDPNLHGGNAVYASGARVPLATNPLTTNGTTTVSLAWANNGMSASETFVITGATAVSGFTASGTYTVITANSTTVTFSTGGATPAAATGGGANIIAWATNDIPRATFEADGAWVSGLRTDVATFSGNAIQLAAGQGIGYTGTGSVGIQGSNTNDSAPAGDIGEYLVNSGVNTSATVTITIASPGVVTWTAHGFLALTPVYFSTTGALPTGISTFTTYYITAGSVTANTFQISTTTANALAGTSINTTGTQSGTQTGHTGLVLGSAFPFDVVGVQLNAGDYDCQAIVTPGYGGSTSVTQEALWLSTSGGSAMPTTVPAILASGMYQYNTAAIVTPTNTFSTGIVRVSLASAGMIVVAAQATFTVSSMILFATLRARRVR